MSVKKRIHRLKYLLKGKVLVLDSMINHESILHMSASDIEVTQASVELLGESHRLATRRVRHCLMQCASVVRTWNRK